jgi:hypothetical protein
MRSLAVAPFMLVFAVLFFLVWWPINTLTSFVMSTALQVRGEAATGPGSHWWAFRGFHAFVGGHCPFCHRGLRDLV